jgi:flagellar assembly protein FliH
MSPKAPATSAVPASAPMARHSTPSAGDRSPTAASTAAAAKARPAFAPGSSALAGVAEDGMRRPVWASVATGTGLRTFADVLGTPPPPEPDPQAEAYELAYAEGLQKAQSQVDAIVEKFHQGIASLELLRDQICRETEEQLVELALIIAREVINSDPEGRRAFTNQMVDEALNHLREAQTITLRMSPDDIAAVRQRHPELAKGNGVLRIVEDRVCELGGVIAETDMGRIDASVERRLSEVARELLADANSPAAGGSGSGEVTDDLAALLATAKEA